VRGAASLGYYKKRKRRRQEKPKAGLIGEKKDLGGGRDRPPKREKKRFRGLGKGGGTFYKGQSFRISRIM